MAMPLTKPFNGLRLGGRPEMLDSDRRTWTLKSAWVELSGVAVLVAIGAVFIGIVFTSMRW